MPKLENSAEIDSKMETSIASLLDGGEKEPETTPEPEDPTSGGEPEGEEEVIADADDDTPETPSEPPSTKIKVGDVEYEPDELNSLIEKGKFAKQVETEQNVDISQLYPEFTRRSQLLKDPENLKKYVKDNFGFDITAPQASLSEEEKALKEQIQQARKAGFLVEEDKQGIISEVMEAIELRDLKKSVDTASKEFGVEAKELIDFMAYLNTRDAGVAAKQLKTYKDVQAGTYVAPKPKSKVVPKKPDVIKTETKGGGTRVPPKEKPLPHPDKDPEAYARRIMEFLEPKSPSEV